MDRPSLTGSILEPSKTPIATTLLLVDDSVKPLSEGNNSSGPLGNLADRHLQHVFSFLEPQDLFRCEMVAPNWRSVAATDDLWETVDLTEFVACTYRHFCATEQDCLPPPPAYNPAERTTQALVDKLTQYSSSIRSLTIRSIHNQLTADYFVLPHHPFRLKVLCLSHFTNLTDTHIRALFFLAASSSPHRRCLTIHTIRLLNCPYVTRACLGSMSYFCPRLLTADVKSTNMLRKRATWSPPSVTPRSSGGSLARCVTSPEMSIEPLYLRVDQ